MTKELGVYSSKEAAEWLGVNYPAFMAIIREGLVEPDRIGNSYIFTEEQLQKIQDDIFPEGLTHTDIAKMYGKGRTTVIYYFNDRLKVKPIGYNRHRRHAAVYDPSTVEKMAKILKWERVDQSS